MVRFDDRTTPDRGQSTARSTTRYPPRTASESRPLGGQSSWQSGQRSWDRPRGDWSGSNRPTWQDNRRQSPASGDRWRSQGQASSGSRWSNNQWPTNRNTFPWTPRQRSWSDSSSAPLRESGQRPRPWGPPPSRPPPGASDTAPRGQENRPPGMPGCLICGRRGCHSDLHYEDANRPRTRRRTACWVCGRPGCHSLRHDEDEPPRQSSTPETNLPPPNTQSQSNRSRGSNQGERAPQSTQTPRPSAPVSYTHLTLPTKRIV